MDSSIFFFYLACSNVFASPAQLWSRVTNAHMWTWRERACPNLGLRAEDKIQTKLRKVEKFMAHSGCGAYKGESQLSESGAFSLVEGSTGMA